MTSRVGAFRPPCYINDFADLFLIHVHEVVDSTNCCVTFVEGTGWSSKNSVGRASVIPLTDLGEDGVDLTVDLSCLALSATTESLEG